VYAYNLTAMAWTKRADMNMERDAFPGVIAVQDDRLLACGGISEGGFGTDTCELYNVTANAWTSAEPMLFMRLYMGFVNYDGVIYSVGGNRDTQGTSYLDDVDVFDVVKTNWTKVNPPLLLKAEARTAVALPKMCASGVPGRLIAQPMYLLLVMFLIVFLIQASS